MPRDSQGLYTLPAGNPVVPGTLIEAGWANPTMSDIGDALTGSLPRDGSAPMTAPLTLAATMPTLPRQATSKAYVDQFIAYATGLPLAAIITQAGGAAPPGFLLCDGAAVSRVTYADLFAAIGTIYGSGDNSTTFNLPNLQGQFIRGRDSSRAIGSLQTGSVQSHSHSVADPGHTHSASQGVHNHSVTTNSHTHGVTDPGHTHGSAEVFTPGGSLNPAVAAFRSLVPLPVAQTGISIQSAGNIGGFTSTVQPAVTNVANTTGLTVAASGGSETVPQNIALDYYIKAVQDSTASPGSVVSITSSDPNMIAIDLANPSIPELDIKSNVAFGSVKLDASGKVPLNQMPTSSQAFLGYFSAASGALPTGTFSSGSFYAISVAGTLTVYNPVTLVASPTLVAVGGQIHYVSGSVTNPTGWYYLTVSGATLASDVQFIPVGGISATNVQTAIGEVDSEKVAKSGSTMTGALKTKQVQLGTSATASHNFTWDASTDDGSMSLSRGDAGTPITNVLSFGGAGDAYFAASVYCTNLNSNVSSSDYSQIGKSATPANNFTMDATADNGTMKLARGNAGVTTQDIMTVDAVGAVYFLSPIAAPESYVTTAYSPNYQLGRNATPANNFTLTTAGDGTMKLARGNVGVTTQDLITVSANGTLSLRLVEYANDGAAATGGVPVGGLYKTSGTVKVRVT